MSVPRQEGISYEEEKPIKPMLGILKVAVRMIINGEMDEREVAEGLVNILKQKYNLTEGETYHDPKGLAGESKSVRLVCRNTMPEFTFKDEPWHSDRPLSLSDMAGNDSDY